MSAYRDCEACRERAIEDERKRARTRGWLVAILSIVVPAMIGSLVGFGLSRFARSAQPVVPVPVLAAAARRPDFCSRTHREYGMTYQVPEDQLLDGGCLPGATPMRWDNAAPVGESVIGHKAPERFASAGKEWIEVTAPTRWKNIGMSVGCPRGWRLPTVAELMDLHDTRHEEGLSYWAAPDDAGVAQAVAFKHDRTTRWAGTDPENNQAALRCVQP